MTHISNYAQTQIYEGNVTQADFIIDLSYKDDHESDANWRQIYLLQAKALKEDDPNPFSAKSKFVPTEGQREIEPIREHGRLVGRRYRFEKVVEAVHFKLRFD